MLPIADDHPTRVIPLVTWSLMGACILTFFYELSLPVSEIECFIKSYGMIPAEVFGRSTGDPRCLQVPETLTIFTSMFLHASWFHLIGNMLFLWIFGDNVEDSLSLDSLGPVFGWLRYLAFYLVCGVAAAMTQSYIALEMGGADIPMIGASGAVSGILGAYLLLYPRAQVLVVIFIFVTVVPAWLVLGVWMLLQVVSVLAADPNQPGVAFWAHIGGFVAGFILIKIFGGQTRPPNHPPSIGGISTGRSLRCQLHCHPHPDLPKKRFSVIRRQPKVYTKRKP